MRRIQGFHDAFVPEAGPALIHDLGLDLRDKVLRLFMRNSQQVFLPIAEIGVVAAAENKDVLFRI